MKLIASLVPLVALFAVAQAQLTPNTAATILRAHNEARSKVKPTASNMERMVWNPTLAMIAQEYAENCIWEPNDMRHAEAEHLFPTGVGENMALNYGRSSIINQNPVQFIQEWVDEGFFYNITHNICEPGRVCSHHAQVMSATTTAVGCGFHICQEFEFYGSVLPLAAFFVCNYGPEAPAINQGTRPYMPGAPCTGCPFGKQLCVDNLCQLGMARAPPAMSYPTDPMPMPTTAGPTGLPGVTQPTNMGGAVQPTEPFFGGATASPGQIGGINTAMPTTEPAVRVTMNPADMNCTSPATVLEREQCWLQAWTDWRRKFDSWVHVNCPGP